MATMTHAKLAKHEVLELLRAIESSIQANLTGRLRSFRLEWSEQGLVLRGHARSYYTKQLAQQAVMTATEMPISANNIAVS